MTKPWEDEALKHAIRELVEHRREPTHGGASAFAERILRLECRGHTALDLLARVAPLLHEPVAGRVPLVLLVEDVDAWDQEASDFLRHLADAAVKTGSHVWVVERSGTMAALAASLGIPLESVRFEPPGAPVTPKEVLALQDEEDVIEWVRSVLSAGGHRVRIVRSSFDALQELSRRPFDGVVVDGELGHADGLEAACAIARRHPVLPIVLMGKWTSQDPGPQVRVWSRIPKPYSVPRLLRAVANVM